MARNQIRYQMLQNDDLEQGTTITGSSSINRVSDSVSVTDPASTVVTILLPAADQHDDGLPPYSALAPLLSQDQGATAMSGLLPEIPPDIAASFINDGDGSSKMVVLPEYDIASELPSYEESQILKAQEEADESRFRQQAALFDELTRRDVEDPILGSDFIFMSAFFVAFLFNWIGFLVMMCFCQTIAGRYGALSGFGLSLAKWTLIVKHSTDLISPENSWLWWIILAFGLVICARGAIQYVHVKRQWRLLSRSTQERLMHFY